MFTVVLKLGLIQDQVPSKISSRSRIAKEGARVRATWIAPASNEHAQSTSAFPEVE